jgi:hypothetical protein
MFIPFAFNNLSGVAKMTATTTATIVSVGTPIVSQSTSSNSSSSNSCSLTAKYIVNGVQEMGTSAINSNINCSKAVGDTLTINYDPNHPSSWSSDTKTLGSFLNVFFFAGLLVTIVSFITFIIRLVSIIFGWKLLKGGRALAKSLPEGTNLATITEEIKQHFKGSVFGLTTPMFQSQTAVQPSVVQSTGVALPIIQPPSPMPLSQPAASVNPAPLPNPPTEPTKPS